MLPVPLSHQHLKLLPRHVCFSFVSHRSFQTLWTTLVCAYIPGQRWIWSASAGRTFPSFLFGYWLFSYTNFRAFNQGSPEPTPHCSPASFFCTNLSKDLIYGGEKGGLGLKRQHISKGMILAQNLSWLSFLNMIMAGKHACVVKQITQQMLSGCIAAGWCLTSGG